MTRKALFVIVLVLSAWAAGSALGAWDFSDVYTFKWPAEPLDPCDGRFYNSDGTTLVKDGALLQIIVGLNEAPIVDPYEYFLGGGGGGGLEACAQWLRAGADPAAISGGTNVLAAGGTLTGEFELVGGVLDWTFWEAGLPDPARITDGEGCDPIAIRVWNLTKDELTTFGTRFEEVWYMTDRERGHSTGPYAPPDMAMVVGYGDVPPGGDPVLYGWSLSSVFGAEVDQGLRLRNELDVCLIAWIPEPNVLLLIGSSVLLVALRRRG